MNKMYYDTVNMASPPVLYCLFLNTLASQGYSSAFTRAYPRTKHDDLVIVHHSIQPMCDRDSSTAPEHLSHQRLDLAPLKRTDPVASFPPLMPFGKVVTEAALSTNNAETSFIRMRLD